MSNVQPFDGTAVILHLIEAARHWRNFNAIDGMADPDAAKLQYWIGELERYYEREQPPAEPAGWEPRRMGEVVAGDRVSLQGVEADVVAAQLQQWHARPPAGDPNSWEYRNAIYNPQPFEHSVIAVTLRINDQDRHYPRMNPELEVEVLRGPAGRALDEANGYRSALGEEPVDVMQSWAADAAATLEAGGLGPVEVIR